MAQYLPIFTLSILAIGFAAGQIALARFVGPRNVNNAKYAPYECGIVPEVDPPRRFPVRFYLVALIFVVFDVEVIFLYPYVLVYRSLGLFGLVEMALFSVAVVACLIFLIANGALDWGPSGVVRRPTEEIVRATEADGVRLVGLEGRDPRQEVAA
ncbi:MAG: NADH-quinone oxidoreductase subunit A [Actinobacteria bacterium]|nr:NADH-quinone oxidoreductase subunit A [Actinomycetota bacterium]